jgi:hypothetical protein
MFISIHWYDSLFCKHFSCFFPHPASTPISQTLPSPRLNWHSEVWLDLIPQWTISINFQEFVWVHISPTSHKVTEGREQTWLLGEWLPMLERVFLNDHSAPPGLFTTEECLSQILSTNVEWFPKVWSHTVLAESFDLSGLHSPNIPISEFWAQKKMKVIVKTY